MSGIHIANIEELPHGTPLERPLHKKKRRTWSPGTRKTRRAVKSDSPLISTATKVGELAEVVVEQLDEKTESRASTHARNIGSPAVPPSPVMFTECGGSNSSSTTPARSPVRYSRPGGPLRESENKYCLNNGSEPESDSDEEEVGAPMAIPRTFQILMDTPQDEEDVVQASPVSSVFTPATPEPPLAAMYQPTHFYNFKWTPFPNLSIPPESRRETFSNINVGPTTPYHEPYDAFIAIWDRKFIENIASETNKYAQQLALQMLNNDALSPSSRICDWRDTSADEIYLYFGILLAMGIVVKSKIEEYWSVNADIFCTPGFRGHMSLRRFQLLNKCIHFSDNESMCGQELTASEAKLFKIQPVVLHLNTKFESMYNMRQNIALDESLLQWKGWLDINQFIPNKAASVGIKTYEICESQTGYLWRFEVHAHKKALPVSQQLDPLEASTPSIVLRLTRGLEYKGHTLWMDNFYNSPALARRLKTQGFDCVGTLRTNRQFVPEELTNLTKANMRPGQITGFTSGDVDLMVWRDQNRVAMISTYHGNAIDVVSSTPKPILILDYNIMMGGVDKKDQMLAMFPIERKRTRVWYKKLFRRLLNVSVLNSYILVKQSSSTSLSHRSFRISLVNSLLQKHSSAKLNHIARQVPVFEAKYHYLAEYPFLPGNSCRQRRVCVVCKKRVHLHCVGCNKTVCMNSCFVSLHS